MSTPKWTALERVVVWIGASGPIIGRANAMPLRRTVEDFGNIDANTDAWAEALSGISPLILLIGERKTKQLLRDVRGVPGIMALAVAPLGLLSILTSMVRLCGG